MEALVKVKQDLAESLQKIPAEILDPLDYPRVVFTLSGIAEDKSWGDLGPTGLSRPEYMMLKRRSKEFAALAKEMETIRDAIRQDVREDEAHRRAVDGELVPTVDMKGNIVEWYPKRSDKLMETLLKANDPKYREPKADSQGGARVVLQVNLGIPSRQKIVTIEGDAHVEEVQGSEAGAAGAKPADGGAAPRPGSGGPVNPPSGLIQPVADQLPE